MAQIRAKCLAIAAYKKINSHGRAHQDDEGLHPGLREFLCKVRRGVSAQQRARSHDDGLRPDDGARHNESHRGDAVDDAAENHLELVHGMDVGHPKRGEHCQIHDAYAAAEIAAINGDEQLEEGCPGDRGCCGIV